MALGTWSEAEALAKINLRLLVFPPAADGFHPLETIFCRIDFADRVRLCLLDDPGVTLRVTGPETAPQGSANLVVSAAQRLLEAADAQLGVQIELEKRIPAGAGLGGGSSDAAATLRLLNAALDAPLATPELYALTPELGSDVAFFLCDTPLALAWGRGERLLRGPKLGGRPVLLILPSVSISTPAAYAALDEWRVGQAVRRTPLSLAWSDLADWQMLSSLARNDFEDVVYEQYPRLRDLKKRLQATQPEICLLCGSGAALFAVYESTEGRDAARRELEGGLEDARLVSAIAPV